MLDNGKRNNAKGKSKNAAKKKTGIKLRRKVKIHRGGKRRELVANGRRKPRGAERTSSNDAKQRRF